MSKKSRKILAKLNDARFRDRLLDVFNQDSQSQGAPVKGGSDEMKVLKEINEMQDAHDEYMDSLKGADREG